MINTILTSNHVQLISIQTFKCWYYTHIIQYIHQSVKNWWHQLTRSSALTIIIIIRGQFIKRRTWWFGPSHQGRFDILTMMGRECSRLDPSYQRHITFACTGSYQLHPHHRLGIITPRLIASTNLPTSKWWIAWWANADCRQITFTQGYYTTESKGTGRKWTQVIRPKTNSIPVNQMRRK